ncbi:hypothetical protein PCANC_12533 [Puccinia coronata f. sp. avenae]|uniref:Uncharacterized protein n=1 Tax=Puccinia coronata f. sp. avenae TaxID=200324 RepID=A0A2N5SSQ0_9BASI|nr:hypothetical protein PCANC_12533 [Puccinia coronata f. sp. avenae]
MGGYRPQPPYTRQVVLDAVNPYLYTVMAPVGGYWRYFLRVPQRRPRTCLQALKEQAKDLLATSQRADHGPSCKEQVIDLLAKSRSLTCSQRAGH